MKTLKKILASIIILTIITYILSSIIIQNKSLAVTQSTSTDINSIDTAKYPGIKEKIQALQKKMFCGIPCRCRKQTILDFWATRREKTDIHIQDLPRIKPRSFLRCANPLQTMCFWIAPRRLTTRYPFTVWRRQIKPCSL